MNDMEMAVRLAELTAEKGGTAYFVGGYVRDNLMGRECKDIDVEVHGIPASVLENILDSLGERMEIGESFGIYGIKGSGLDIALPRRETATGRGHRDFDITADPFIGTEKAAKRRDFTINALMENILTGEITDHFGGVSDIENKIIRHVNEKTFPEDPLRVLRAAQFAARFDFCIAEETMEICRNIDTSTLSKERIEAELMKALLRAEKPSVFFEVLKEMNQLSVWFPETECLIGVPQNSRYHMEGDVWNHTMMVLDEAAKLREKVSYPYGFMVSALVHDFGKAVSTTEVKGVIHSYDHETKGIPLIREFLRRITGEKRLVRYVLNMAELHMKPNVLAAAEASVKSTNKMFDRSVSPADLIYLAIADDRGRKKLAEGNDHGKFLFERLEEFNRIMAKPYVTGKDLIDSGLVPDKNFSEILSYAHKLRLAGTDKESALRQAVSYGKKIYRKNNPGIF
ncbi:MAG: CCA tRNA nucleotidyltransferase [Ruminococcus sp.]